MALFDNLRRAIESVRDFFGGREPSAPLGDISQPEPVQETSVPEPFTEPEFDPPIEEEELDTFDWADALDEEEYDPYSDPEYVDPLEEYDTFERDGYSPDDLRPNRFASYLDARTYLDDAGIGALFDIVWVNEDGTFGIVETYDSDTAT